MLRYPSIKMPLTDPSQRTADRDAEPEDGTGPESGDRRADGCGRRHGVRYAVAVGNEKKKIVSLHVLYTSNTQL